MSPRFGSLGSLGLLDRSRRRSIALAFQQFPLLASGLTTDALRGQVPGAFGVGSFELVESPSNCPAVDAELIGNVCLALTSMNAPAYPLNVPIGKFGCGSQRSQVRSLSGPSLEQSVSPPTGLCVLRESLGC